MEPHRFEENLRSVAQPQNQFDLRSFFRHLVDFHHRQCRHRLQQIVDVGAPLVELVLRYVVVEILPRRTRPPVQRTALQ